MFSATNKFKAKKQYLDDCFQPTTKEKAVYKFDSILERDVFLILYRCGLKQVKIHSPIKLIPTSIKENIINWNIDFVVNESLYLEAKGMKTEGFLLKMKLFREFHPEKWKNFYLVCSDSGYSSLSMNQGLKPEKEMNKIIPISKLGKRIFDVIPF
ncbi:MAG: hypothetical protein N5P05_000493 [Chroococcopsis gigantea SAG 12.99]|jgi:hypothetical protein|nr:hypothetical protein [Chlorogloea purpurea SAG 13.99]MDV2998887.1 hypothetical protein [Chroococcopsis gigantea SAG 12.99]